MGSEASGSKDRLQGRRPPGTRRAWLRWLPAVAAPAVIAAVVLAGTFPARASDPLPEKSPAQVMELLAGHRTHAFSATVEQSSELGLPELPASGPSSGPASAAGAASVFELLSGDHTARVFMDGKTKVRVQVVDRLAERDLIRNGSDVWLYSSRDNSAIHATLPDHSGPGHTQDHSAFLPTPGEIAARFLAKVDPTTSVTVGEDVDVAGRTAYNLVLEPRTESTLVGRVAIAVDGETGMPLSVQVTARGADAPAFRAAFTKLSLGAPEGALFNFVPPPGSMVEELESRYPARWPLSSGFPGTPGMMVPPDYHPGTAGKHGRAAVTGKGWEAVVELPATAPSQRILDEALLEDPLLSQAAVVVPGGRLLSTALFNVLMTDDGRILAGMVPPEMLQAAASPAP